MYKKYFFIKSISKTKENIDNTNIKVINIHIFFLEKIFKNTF